nr:MAG TPA: hypothetical protein [Caudoviricetes sp.]
MYCILWHHAQLIAYNVILSHSIVMFINCVQFNLRLSYCVG